VNVTQHGSRRERDDWWNFRIPPPLVQLYSKRFPFSSPKSAVGVCSIAVMKHRHTFFLRGAEPPPPDAFELVPEKGRRPPTLHIKHLHAAQEWKIMMDEHELAPEVSASSNTINVEISRTA
jgi:hypothetical protein